MTDREWTILNGVEALTTRANQIELIADELIEESDEKDTITRGGIVKVLCGTLLGEIEKISAFMKGEIETLEI